MRDGTEYYSIRRLATERNIPSRVRDGTEYYSVRRLATERNTSVLRAGWDGIRFRSACSRVARLINE